MFQLRTKRLLLRDFLLEDLIPFQQIGNNPEALKYYSQNSKEWESHAEILVQRFIASQGESPRQKYSLAITASGSFVGGVSIRVDSVENRQGSVGCVLAHKYWSFGYASEAMAAALTLGFEKLNLHRISAETISENSAALTLAKRQGMRVEGLLRENQYFKGRWWNTTILGLLRSEWQEKPAS